MKKAYIVDLLFCIFIFALCFSLPVLLSLVDLERVFPNLTRSGLIGDSFGSANALFSGLAFYAVVITLRLQRHQIQIQGEELKNSQKVMDEQSKTTAQQIDLMKVSALIAALPVLIENAKRELAKRGAVLAKGRSGFDTEDVPACLSKVREMDEVNQTDFASKANESIYGLYTRTPAEFDIFKERVVRVRASLERVSLLEERLEALYRYLVW